MNRKDCNESLFTIPGTVTWKLLSLNKQHEYRIYIYRPSEPPPSNGYPVLYLLDANAIFGSFAEAVRLQTRKPHGYEPMVVVGIAYDTNEPFHQNRRIFDYTVEALSNELPIRPNGSNWPKTGGADAFLAFIEEELKPAIQKSISVDPMRQSLFGHSLGGLFALYVFFTKTTSFQNYIAGSPSIWWKNRYILELEKTYCDHLDSIKRNNDTGLLLAVGGNEKTHMIQDAASMFKRLKNYPLRTEFSCYEDEGHVSILHSLISRSLKFVLRKD
ncbi:alpha/beta hydrolase [Metabacillus idriensis]|uniref:alpha/beta hydrolase n=1 Tax=Metabacillus idriensis TaxID=324768 RepID=UPI00174E4F56|nr:alpha/beta hydrolase-fold protein [Metabacillus idriensis]